MVSFAKPAWLRCSIVLMYLTTSMLPASVWANNEVSATGTSAGRPEGENDPSYPGSDPTPDDENCTNGSSASSQESSQNASPTPRPGVGQAGEPVFLVDGSFYNRRVDLTIPGRIPIVIRRTYSTKSAFNGVMGYGWSLNYHMRLFPLDNGNMLLKRGDAVKHTFTDNGDDTYASPDGEHETIARNPDGSYTLMRKSGFAYEFDVDGKLAEMRDHSGNQLLFSYDPAGLLPINGKSEFAIVDTPILIGYDYRLTRIDEAHAGVPTSRFVELFYNGNGRVERIADFTGREVLYAYDPTDTGDLLTVTDPELNLFEYTYDDKHRMLTFVGAGCADCSLHANVYDAQGRCIQQTHGSLVVDIDYVDPGVRTKVTTWIYNDGTGELLHTRFEYYEFDSAGRTLKFTRQLGNELDELPGSTEDDDIVTTYSYIETGPNTGSLAGKVDPRGIPTTYTYDGRGNLLEELITDPADPLNWWKTNYEYNDLNAPNQYSAMEISASFDPQTYRTEWTYWPNRRIKDILRFPDDVITYVTHHTYTPQGDLLARTDPRGNTIQYEYNNFGFRTREYDPANPSHQTLYTPTALGDLATSTDANGNTTTLQYDSLRRIRVITDALGRQILFTHTTANLTEIEYGRTPSEPGRRILLDYDGLNRLMTVKGVGDSGATVMLVSFTLDSEGRHIVATFGNNNPATLAYDVIGRLAAESDALLHTTAYGYDKNDNLLSVFDAESNETNAEYDFLDRKTLFHYGASYVIQSSHIATGRVAQMLDANSHSTTFRYDGLSRIIQEEDALGNITDYQYDGNNNFIGKITPNEWAGGQRSIVYIYDAYNRRETMIYPETSPGVQKTVTYTYDEVGNRLSWTDGTFSETATYDELNRVESRATDYPGFSKIVSYTYDAARWVRSVTDGEGRTTSYHRDALGRLRYIAHPGSMVTEYRYDPARRLSERIIPNAVRTTFDYDAANRLTSLVNIGPSGILSSFEYTYDKVGNRTSMTTLAGVDEYGYSDTYQLTSASHPEPTNPAESYSYDGVQNRLTSENYSDWTYDATNFLESYGPYTFTRDSAGNTTSKNGPDGLTTYEYDFDNNLLGASTPTENVTFGYTPSRRRLSKDVDGIVTYFLYDREDVIGEYDAAGVLIRAFLQGQGIDEPIAMIDGAEFYQSGDFNHDGAVDLDDYIILADLLAGPVAQPNVMGDLNGDGLSDLLDFAVFQREFGAQGKPASIQFYVQDGLGSVVNLTDNSGVLMEGYVYDSFGTPVEGVGDFGNPYFVTGRRYDSETEAYYYRTRFYVPGQGRFLTGDMLGTWADAINFGNESAYVGNNPRSRVDPFGLAAFKDCVVKCVGYDLLPPHIPACMKICGGFNPPPSPPAEDGTSESPSFSPAQPSVMSPSSDKCQGQERRICDACRSEKNQTGPPKCTAGDPCRERCWPFRPSEHVQCIWVP